MRLWKEDGKGMKTRRRWREEDEEKFRNGKRGKRHKRNEFYLLGYISV
jgi:hypothetical protein